MILWTIPVQRSLIGGAKSFLASPIGMVLGTLVVVALVVGVVRGLGRFDIRRLVPPVLAYLVALWYLNAIPDEIVHLLEYGILAGLLRRALPGAGAAIGVAGLIGGLDEITQGVTAGRVFDVRDIGINVVAAALAVWFFEALQKGKAR